MIEFVCDLLYNNDIISKELIYKSFRVTGIANNLNHSEDNLFTVWKAMEKEQPIRENDLEVDYSCCVNLVADEEED